MNYSKSNDGVLRAGISVIIRLDEKEIQEIATHLKLKGEPFDMRAVKDFVRSCTEYTPISLLRHSSKKGLGHAATKETKNESHERS